MKKICFLLSVFLLAPLFSCSNKGKLLKLSKDEYLRDEDILVTATASDSKAWVGLYRENDEPQEVDSIYWYYVSDFSHSSGATYSIQHYGTLNESRITLKNLPPYYYKVVYFSHDYEVVTEKKFKIKASRLPLPSAPSDVKCTFSNPDDGLAQGTLEVTFAEESNVSDIVMYWANDDGILSDYEALAKEKVNSGKNTIKLRDRTIIPSGATSLWIYGSNNAGLSSEPYKVSLPSYKALELSESIAKYMITSDVHIATEDTHLASSDANELHDEHFLMMLEDAKDYGEDSILINGDIANSGSENEWKHEQELVSSVTGLPSIYYSIGNHDLYGGSYQEASTYFKKYADVDSVYYSVDIKGYHHIFLGSEDSTKSSVDAWLSDTQLEWFEKELESQPSDKPVFVYLHQSLYNTVAGSFKGQGWNGITQDDQVREILSKHKNAIFFNGHSHWDLNSKGNMYPKDEKLGNIFNNASVAYLWDDYYLHTGAYEKGSQGYHVEVYEDKMLVLGRNYETGKYIPSGCYMIEI